MIESENITNPPESSKVPPSEGFREAFTLHLADNALVLAQRNGEWCGHGPVLEQDIAITNITLDLIGQSRNLYQYAAELINRSAAELNKPATEDSLAYLRTEREFKNCLITELPNGDWGQTILRQFFFSQYQYLLFDKLQHSSDEQLSAISAKALKEVTYHLRWSRDWVVRLGDGTEESHSRMTNAVAALWTYTGEFFMPADYESALVDSGIAVDPASLKNLWLEKVKAAFEEATLDLPGNVYQQSGGKQGIHTEHLGHLLTDLQYMQRAYPDCEW
jgi:ring-1,2-phenylacetyl-CoA epoxidase subunit PaaC